MSKRNVSCVKPSDPPFLRRLKEQIGYKEGATIDTKREELPVDDGEDDDRDDEKPVVVVLKPGDLTEEEATEIEADFTLEEGKPKDSKIVFKKPEKKRLSNDDGTPVPDEIPKKKTKTEKSKPTAGEMKKLKSSSLLSFDNEEDDD